MDKVLLANLRFPLQSLKSRRKRRGIHPLEIKEKLGTSDRETVEQILENPYLQYFLTGV
jgi:IS5 family transposase